MVLTNEHLVPNGSTSEDLSEKFQALFPTWTTVLATIIALLILLIVLTKLAYNPVKKMHDKRKNYIQDNIDSAEAQNAYAASDREQANDELIQARLSAAELIKQAKIEASEVRAIEITKAEAEAARVINDAKVEMLNQQLKFEEESKNAIIDVAIAAAGKVIEKEVDNKTNRKIVVDYVEAQK